MEIKELSINNAKEICEWKYENEYSIYNYPNWEFVVKNNWALYSKPNEFKAIYLNNEFIAYYRLVNKEEHIIIGLGIKPSLCGQGLGHNIVELIKKNTTGILRLEVREFNKRAIKCYESCGFKIIDKYFKKTLIGDDNFILMEYK